MKEKQCKIPKMSVFFTLSIPQILILGVWMEQNHPRFRYPALLSVFLIIFLLDEALKYTDHRQKKCHKMLQNDFWGVFGGGPDFRQF